MKTPELDKMAKVREQSQGAGAFLDWLSSEKNLTSCEQHEHDDTCYGKDDIRMCGFRDGDYVPASVNIEKLLAEYFDIDLEKAENERRKILASLQKAAK